MPLTKKQTRQAARLYALALVAHVGGIADDEEQDAVKEAARRRAQGELDRLGVDAGQLVTIEDCINAACGRVQPQRSKNK